MKSHSSINRVGGADASIYMANNIFGSGHNVPYSLARDAAEHL